MPRTSSNEEGDTGPFYATECPGHHGHFGGGNTLPPTVTPMQHSVTLTCVEWESTVLQRIGAEEKAVSGGGIEGELG